jgi:hypothetical protein
MALDSQKNGRSVDDDDFELPSIKKKGRDYLPLYLLTAGGLVLFLIASAVVVILVVAFNKSNEPTATRIIGAWKGQFVLNGQPLDFVFTFNKDGSLRQDGFDLRGRRLPELAGGGRWRIRDGDVEIDWDGNGGRERATVRWIDDNAMEYRIIQHTEVVQIGMETTFRRQR